MKEHLLKKKDAQTTSCVYDVGDVRKRRNCVWKIRQHYTGPQLQQRESPFKSLENTGHSGTKSETYSRGGNMYLKETS